VKTLKLDNYVAVPLARLEPPTAAAAVGPLPVSPPLPTDAALRRGHLLLSYGVARGGRDEAAGASWLQPLYPLSQIATSIKTTPPTPAVAAASPRA